MCVCVCVCLKCEGSEIIWNKCEKEKGKEGERHLSVSVTAPRHLCKGRCGHYVGLCKGYPPCYIPTEFVWYMTMYTVSFFF